MLDLIYITFIIASAFIGLMLVKASSLLSYKLLVLLLVVTSVNETVCYFLKQSGVQTHVFYNVYYYFRFPLIGMIFYLLCRRQRFFSFFIISFYLLTAVIFLICFYLYNGFNKLHTPYLLAGGIFTITLCLAYLLRLFRSDEIFNPFTVPFFWTSMGLLFFFLGVLPYLGLINYLVQEHYLFASQPMILVKILSILLYTLISTDIYIQWKQMKLKC